MKSERPSGTMIEPSNLLGVKREALSRLRELEGVEVREWRKMEDLKEEMDLKDLAKREAEQLSRER